MESTSEEYEKQQLIFYNNDFWNRFVHKTIDKLEDQLWDFKKTLDWWHPDCKDKKQKQIDFSEKVASFANSDGGIILIGITNKKPRIVVGVEKPEEKMKTVSRTLTRLTNLKLSDFLLRSISIKSSDGISNECFLLAIAQTTNYIEVKGVNGRLSYPIRKGSELILVNIETIIKNKENVNRNNYNFFYKIAEFIASS